MKDLYTLILSKSSPLVASLFDVNAMVRIEDKVKRSFTFNCTRRRMSNHKERS